MPCLFLVPGPCPRLGAALTTLTLWEAISLYMKHDINERIMLGSFRMYQMYMASVYCYLRHISQQV